VVRVVRNNLIVNEGWRLAGLPRGQFGGIQQTRAGESVMKNLFVRFVREEEGQDLIEYALLAGLISVICIVAITSAGQSVKTLFEKVSTALSTAAA
jgi:pilus assembly protein Flp/PilA